MDAKVTWNGKMSFTGTADTGFELPLDAESAVGGSDSGFRPMELIAMGLAGCTAMDVIAILTKKRQQVAGFEVQVSAEQAEQHPHVFTGAVINYRVIGRGIDPAAVLRSIELSATRYCPAQAMLEKSFPIKLAFEVYEDQGEEKPRLVETGEYVKLIEPQTP